MVVQPNTSLEPFIVRESSSTNFVFGSLFLFIFLISLIAGDFGWSNYLMSIGLFLLPGVWFIWAGINRREILRLNASGIFYKGRMVCDWDHFSGARLFQDQRPGEIKDRFCIMIEYSKDGSDQYFGRKIPMSNTQDKADEEIMDAIKSWYRLHQVNSTAAIKAGQTSS